MLGQFHFTQSRQKRNRKNEAKKPVLKEEISNGEIVPLVIFFWNSDLLIKAFSYQEFANAVLQYVKALRA